MRAAVLLLALALGRPDGAAVTSDTSPAGAFSVRSSETVATFTVRKWRVMKVTGRFSNVAGSIQLDPKRPEASRIAFRVAVASIDTGEKARDETLLSEDFFDARRHPDMSFVSSRVIPTGENAADVIGDLTIRGVTRRITVPVRLLGLSVEGDRELAGFETEFTIDRREFGVNGTRWSGGKNLISNEVAIQLTVGAARGGR